ncbi:hypothetical protein [Amycolatopsis sp. PS_44_ISF1]|uniref:hypothetical protein n=1 Tax=Amycolatopsis sp. PS_44_ISF1 TaxID=2974917 RepID=UPI0028DF0E46|nr:hypothetical protein [Amycolatopsis sp. PS_44_ISF1]MDT8912923.1 hypothetical protein [Amycolatopsis sp. PS_44_ISF1]
MARLNGMTATAPVPAARGDETLPVVLAADRPGARGTGCVAIEREAICATARTAGTDLLNGFGIGGVGGRPGGGAGYGTAAVSRGIQDPIGPEVGGVPARPVGRPRLHRRVRRAMNADPERQRADPERGGGARPGAGHRRPRDRGRHGPFELPTRRITAQEALR